MTSGRSPVRATSARLNDEPSVKHAAAAGKQPGEVCLGDGEADDRDARVEREDRVIARERHGHERGADAKIATREHRSRTACELRDGERRQVRRTRLRQPRQCEHRTTRLPTSAVSQKTLRQSMCASRAAPTSGASSGTVPIDRGQQREQPRTRDLAGKIPGDGTTQDRTDGRRHPLQAACGEQPAERRCERAGRGGQHEADQAGEHRAASANTVAEESPEQLAGRETRQKRRDDQATVRGLATDRASGRRQRDQRDIERDRPERDQPGQDDRDDARDVCAEAQLS